MPSLNNGMLDTLPDRSTQVTPRHLAALGDAIRRRVPDDQDRGVVLDMLGLAPRTHHATVPRTWRQVHCPWCGADAWDDCRSAGRPSRKPHQRRIDLAAANPHEGTS